MNDLFQSKVACDEAAKCIPGIKHQASISGETSLTEQDGPMSPEHLSQQHVAVKATSQSFPGSQFPQSEGEEEVHPATRDPPR